LGQETCGEIRRQLGHDKWLEGSISFYAQARATLLAEFKRLYSSAFKRAEKPRVCEICGATFSLKQTHPLFYSRLFGDSISYCTNCLGWAIWNSVPYGRDFEDLELLRHLVQLRNLCGFIPPNNYKSNYDFVMQIQKSQLTEALSHLQRMASPEIYKERFGSWLKALIAAELLPEGTRRGGRGIQCVAEDGHDCLSMFEKFVDDWLFRNGFEHIKEPRYPRDDEFNPNGQMRADWQVGGLYIEFLGLPFDHSYMEKLQKKRNLCRKYDLRLIEIGMQDLGNLEQSLGSILHGMKNE
jgi:hypothetical protein